MRVRVRVCVCDVLCVMCGAIPIVSGAGGPH